MQVLKKGSRGEEVKRLQKLLHLYEDGIFGSITEEAVKAFQREHRLVADGIVGTQTWFMLAQLDRTLKVSKRKIKEIIVHCTATEEGKDFTVADVRKWHLKRGFSDIGYHYLIYRDGSVHEGRDVNLIGAHCTNHNSYSIGVCYVGGYKKGTRTPEQKASLLKLLKDLKAIYPNAKIYGHRDWSSKPCPCFDAKNEYRNI